MNPGSNDEQQEIFSKLCEILNALRDSVDDKGLREYNSNMQLSDCSLDSLGVVEFGLHIEDAFGVPTEEQNLTAGTTLYQVIQLIQEKKGN